MIYDWDGFKILGIDIDVYICIYIPTTDHQRLGYSISYNKEKYNKDLLDLIICIEIDV